jgi:hypothetical protein
MDSKQLHDLVERLPPDVQEQLYDYAQFLLERKTRTSPPRKERVANLHPGAAVMSDDFDAPLPDRFWLGEDER